jgi:hypothetical protein
MAMEEEKLIDLAAIPSGESSLENKLLVSKPFILVAIFIRIDLVGINFDISLRC